MLYGKKISYDFLHLSLIMALVRLGPEVLWSSQWHESVEVIDVGSTLVRQPFYSHNLRMISSGYFLQKNLDSLILDEITFARNRSYFLNNSGAMQSNIIAYYSDTPSSQTSVDQQNEELRVEAESNDNIVASGEQLADERDFLSPQSFENIFSPDTLELSPEDMDLIEILWKQDIDLGVSRDAFNPQENHELERLKVESDLSKGNNEQVKDFTEEVPSKFENDNSAVCCGIEACNYVIDSETGEHVVQEPALNETKASLSLEEFDEFTNSLFSLNEIDGECLNLDKQFFDEEGDEVLDGYDSLDPDLLTSQIETLENMVISSNIRINRSDLDMGSDMYPSMEEYWQDISSTLPLCVMNQSCVIPRPSRPHSVASDEHSVASTSSDLPTSSVGSNDALQIVPENNSSFTYLSPLLGPTSLGCAVASSIATLTNDTDPMPDITAPNNSTFELDLPEMLPANHTTQQSTNEILLTELLLDEDLHLMNASSVAPQFEGPRRSISSMRYDKDTDNNDDVSTTVCNDSKKTKLEELTSASCAGKGLIYGPFRYPSTQFPLSCGLRHVDSSLNNLNCDTEVHTSFRGNYSFLQHNHTYHLPFTGDNNISKPVRRDKEKHFRYDNENSNKDERRAKALDLPITISEIINLAIEEFNEKLSKFELTESQLTLIRDIRRRGKNKVAAQNCRKRKMDQINSLQQDLGVLQEERMQLETDRTHLLYQRRNIREKYSKLCQIMLQSSNSQPLTMANSALSNHQNNSTTLAVISDSCSPKSDADLNYNHGVRTKKKVGKKS